MASKTDSTRVMWRVQVRKSRNHKWMNKGLFETRAAARYNAVQQRHISVFGPLFAAPGFGNTRIVRHVRGGGR